MSRPDRTTARYAGAGIVAAVTAMALAHLAAALLDPTSSPVLAVGSAVIDATPTPVKEWAVRELGAWDKPVLVGSVLAGTLVLAGLAGVLSRRHPVAGLLATAALVALAAAAALLRPDVRPADLVPSAIALVTGPAVLAWLGRLLRRQPPPPADGPSRRGVLIASGVLLAGAAVTAATGQWIVRARSRISDIVLPRAARPLPDLPAGLEAEHRGISDFRTSNRDFYRVDTKLSVPIVDEAEWDLRVDGMVERAVRLTYADLLAMPLIERDIALTCVSNEVGGKLVGGARWLGVPLTTLLERAGVREGADQILSTDVEGFTISTPLDAVLDGREALVAVGMNGVPLPREHGFPARLVVPGLYGFVGATKWLARLTLTTYAEKRAYWTERDWATDAPILISSRIDTPKPLSTVESGRRAIGGVAWAQHVGIERVEVSVDGGPWRPARLGPDAGMDYWRQWYLPWDATPGRHQLSVRAIGSDGAVQSPVRTTPFPRGSTGIQEVVVTVT